MLLVERRGTNEVSDLNEGAVICWAGLGPDHNAENAPKNMIGKMLPPYRERSQPPLLTLSFIPPNPNKV